MELTRFIDDYADDIYALALITTKNFDSAKEIFVRNCFSCPEIDDNTELPAMLKKAYPMCREAESNDSAVTLTGIELDGKKQQLLESVLRQPFIVRAIIHMRWENDLEPEQIAKLTGESLRYVNNTLDELPEELTRELDKSYKDICFRIKADDKLKTYVIRSMNSGKKRQFEVKGEAVPAHKWTKQQKTVIIIMAAVITVVICIVVPLIESYYQMRKDENFESFENVATEDMFRYTSESPSIPDDQLNLTGSDS